MPTLSQLKYIITVEKLRHFGKAADACHVSQPSLSQQIQKVEEEIGVVIFDRLKKPVLPTEKGKRFIEQAKIVLKESQKLMDLSQKEGEEVSGDFRLAIIPTLAPYLLPLFVDSFSQSYPKVNLKVDELKTETILQQLKEDVLDGAILAGPIGEPRLKETILFFEPFYLYVSKEHSLSHRKKISEDDLDGNDMWLLQDGHCLRTQVVKLCSLKNDGGVYKNISFEGGNLETLRYLVRRTRGYTLIPQLFVDTLSEGEKRDYVREFVNPAPSREVLLISRRDHWKSDILKGIEETIRKNLPKTFKTVLDKKKTQVVGI
jgi:LysR family transcriptional regulator, hydrogen peroxide-inducible genes activator